MIKQGRGQPPGPEFIEFVNETFSSQTPKDLAKIVEILARPILHTTDGKEHTFYIIDNNTKYQHKTKA